MGIRDLMVNGPLGFNTTPLGNMFRDIPDHEAAATVDAAWNHGTRFFDTAPLPSRYCSRPYGFAPSMSCLLVNCFIGPVSGA